MADLNISRLSRGDGFTVALTQGMKFIGVFYNILCSCSNKSFQFPRISIILIHIW